jgi:hypothetical protein
MCNIFSESYKGLYSYQFGNNKYEVLKGICEAFFLSTYAIGKIKLSGIISRLHVYEPYNFNKYEKYFVKF